MGSCVSPHPHHPKSVGSSLSQAEDWAGVKGPKSATTMLAPAAGASHLWCQAQIFCTEVNPFTHAQIFIMHL